ncbi:helix-turn-helix transcriptional regulator [Actinocatenispora thailandica]|uniref:helix-turn-helix transcriptional regulator n=1 Tax=Actinocatenispora thailandica TaxID=227318 RepID=UPI0019528B6B|nr:YafY family protein [Actinocatenispora thailandica]
MSGPSTRILRLLSLLQSGRGVAGAELARRLGVSTRTLRRDLDRLRELGYPVVADRGPGGRYRLVAGAALPPLMLGDDEAVVTVLGLRLASAAELGATTGAAQAALRTIERVLPDRLRQRVAAVSATIDAVGRPPGSVSLDAVAALASAAYHHLDVRFRYTTRAGTDQLRRAEPYRLVLFGRRWYLLGHDRDRDGWRTFRLDRMVGLTVPGTTFRPRPVPAAGAVPFVAAAGTPPGRQRGVVRFAAPVATVADRLPAEAGELVAVDESSCRYTTPADSWEWLASMLALVGVPYTVESPPELIEHTRRLAARLAAAAGDAPAS